MNCHLISVDLLTSWFTVEEAKRRLVGCWHLNLVIHFFNIPCHRNWMLTKAKQHSNHAGQQIWSFHEHLVERRVEVACGTVENDSNFVWLVWRCDTVLMQIPHSSWRAFVVLFCFPCMPQRDVLADDLVVFFSVAWVLYESSLKRAELSKGRTPIIRQGDVVRFPHQPDFITVPNVTNCRLQ